MEVISLTTLFTFLCWLMVPDWLRWPIFASYRYWALLCISLCVWSMKHVWRPELVSINNFSNIKEERINKLSSLRLGLILHFLLEKNEKKNIIIYFSVCFFLSIVSITMEYSVCIIGVLSQIIIYIGILNINTSPYIKTITGSLVLELLKHWYKERISWRILLKFIH